MPGERPPRAHTADSGPDREPCGSEGADDGRVDAPTEGRAPDAAADAAGEGRADTAAEGCGDAAAEGCGDAAAEGRAPDAPAVGAGSAADAADEDGPRTPGAAAGSGLSDPGVRRRLAEVFGDLPRITSDEFDEPAFDRGLSPAERDLLANRPPHHDRD